MLNKDMEDIIKSYNRISKIINAVKKRKLISKEDIDELSKATAGLLFDLRAFNMFGDKFPNF